MNFSLHELLAIDERSALQFFFSGLKDVSEPHVRVDDLLYNASVLAHYAQTSCEFVGDDDPCPRDLIGVFDKSFVSEDAGTVPYLNESNGFEVLACQTLLFTGFFRRQMACRHSIRWYESLGAQFFQNASLRESNTKKAEVLSRMSSSFPFWAKRYTRLEHELRIKPYLLNVQSIGGTQ
jgi:hypothetical protein